MIHTFLSVLYNYGKYSEFFDMVCVIIEKMGDFR